MLQAGRLNRLALILREKTDAPTQERVFRGHQTYFDTKDAKVKAAWIRQMIGRLEENCPEEIRTDVMQSCGRKCCGINSRKLAHKLYEESSTLAEFLDKMNRCGLGGGRLILQDSQTISAGYDRCFCGQVSKTEVPFPTQTYCQCSVGWYKQLFETALQMPVEVQLLQSIICGDRSCEFRISIIGAESTQ